MIRRLLLASLFAFSLAAPTFADEAKPDDVIAFDLSGEDWVTTKTAHVTLDVEAAVSGANAGSMRADMLKAVSDTAKGDWRLVNFNRGQDQTGLERWSANFEARLPEAELAGIADAAKKASKAGLQVTLGNIDFAPTLDETEAARAALRVKLAKEANDQLAAINGALSGRGYRIAQIDFGGEGMPPAQMHPLMRRAMGINGSVMAADAAPSPVSMERSEKITMSAHIVYAALPPAAAH